MTFGLTAAGFSPMRLADLVAALQADFKNQFGQNIKLDPASVNGQEIGVMAERFADLWEGLQDVHSSGTLSGARGSALDDLFLLAGLTRNPATLSVVTLTISGTATTPIPAGSSAKDASGTVWTTLSTVAIGGGGTVTVSASPANTGAVPALSGTLNVINSPITGWTSVTNVLDATLGADVESDAKFLSRGIFAIRAGGGSSADVVRSLILRLPGVTECIVIENTSGLPDAAGRPGHSMEVVVRGGVDQVIRDRIWFAKATGVLLVGNTSGTSVDTLGNSHPVLFSRPTTVQIYIAVTYHVLPNFPSDGQTKLLNALLAYGNTLTCGQEVSPWLIGQSLGVSLIDQLTMTLGTGAYSSNTLPITLSLNQLAAFDSSHISFTRTN